MRFEYLADRPELLPQLARLHFAEWSYLRPDETLEGRTLRLRNCCGHKSIPTIVVALHGEELCGSAMLVAHDMETRPDLTPWLAGVYVVPPHRRRGLGSALVERIISEAVALRVPTLYLYTPAAESLYTRLGWTVIDRCEYLSANVAVMSKQLAA
jgi:GNAT superfamily N-acetyltransferase